MTANRNLYILEAKGSRWLWTLATNRAESWKKARPYARNPDGDWKKELKARDGVKCIRVRVVEV